MATYETIVGAIFLLLASCGAVALVAVLIYRWGSSKPLPDDERQWVETTLRTFAETYGSAWLTRAPVILPTDVRFPRPYDHSPQAATRVFEVVCDVIGVDPQYVELVFDSRLTAQTSTAGVYYDSYQQKVALSSQILSDFDGLVASSAHEMAHIRLHRDNCVTPPEVERKPIDDPRAIPIQIAFERPRNPYEEATDLAALFFGFGIFMARVCERSTWRRTNYGTEVVTKKIGYLSRDQICYALGLIAWIRDDKRPPWLGFLESPARSQVKATLRYLRRTKHTSFVQLHDSVPPPSMKRANRLQLQQMLRDAIAREDYQHAAELRDELQRRRKRSR